MEKFCEDLQKRAIETINFNYEKKEMTPLTRG